MFMKYTLVEGVAGSGKTSYIADYVKKSLQPKKALLLTFSRTGKDVMQFYMEKRGFPQLSIHTIDGFAAGVLNQLGDTRYTVKRNHVERELLPQLYEYVIEQAQQYALITGTEPIDAPQITPHAMQEMMSDIDFFRASGAYEYDDDDILQEILTGKLNHDWRLVKRMFYAYDHYRETWKPRVVDNHDLYEEDTSTSIYQSGEQGFRLLGEAVFDLLDYTDDSDILEKIGRKYSLICIDEFHDTTPLQLKFLFKLAHFVPEVIAVGDRFQNIFAWRGTNTEVVFEQFKQRFHAETVYLNHSYRYAQNLANIATNIIHRPIDSKATHKTTVKQLTENDLGKLGKEEVVITEDYPEQIKAAFDIVSRTKQKISIGIHHTMGPVILNVLCALRYGYLLDGKSTKFLKNFALDLAQFYQLSACRLSEEIQQDILNKISLENFVKNTMMQLQQEGNIAFESRFKKSLLEWCASNREHQNVYDIMQWFEQSSGLWAIQSNRLYDQVAKASWDALKQDAYRHRYLWNQWPQQAELLRKRWNMTQGIRFVTIAQAKGREYDNVLIYGATQEGFTHSLLHQQEDLQRNLFYVGITRARKQLNFYVDNTPDLKPIMPITEDEDIEPQGPSNMIDTRKEDALKELVQIKQQLLKRIQH